MKDLKFKKNIGEGYFCIVKKYQNIETKKYYAIKELKSEHYNNPDYIYRFEREIRLTKSLKGHPNIIDIIDSTHDVENKAINYITDLADTNLYKFIKINNQKLKLIDRVVIFEKIIDAVSYAHSKGIVHRDIAPNNVLIFNPDEEIEVKVADFGLGKDVESLSRFTTSSVSEYGQILYVSPEQRDKLSDADMKSDVYSLGKLLYFVMTGKDPDVIRESNFSSIISKAISEEPENRYKDAQEFRDEFIEFKTLLFEENSEEVYSDSFTIKEYLKFNAKINHNHLWTLIQASNVSDHIFYDYIDPLYEYFDNNDINDFFGFIGSEGQKKFGLLYNEAVHKCLNSVGWPFNRTNIMGLFAKKFYMNADSISAKFDMFKVLWELGFVIDQWRVQDIVIDIMSNKIPTNLVDDISVYIKRTGKIKYDTGRTKLKDLDLNKLDSRLKHAIIAVV